MRRALIAALLVLAVSGWVSPPASALGLKVAPLEYNVTLKKGEKQKGFIDLSNPTNMTVRVKSSVQAFRQTDDSGKLTFYDDEKISAGITPDLDELELGPKEAVRMYFLVDGTKLPHGDVFAAIFFTTQPVKKGAGVTELVRLGTILSIVNGTPGERQAEIAELSLPSIQFGDSIKGTYLIRNTGDPERSTGFYPTVVLAVEPFYQEVVQRGRLVFAGRTRENSFEIPSSRLGFYKVSVSYGENSRKEQWVLLVDGVSFAVLLGVSVVALTVGIGWRRARKKPVDNLRINR